MKDSTKVALQLCSVLSAVLILGGPLRNVHAQTDTGYPSKPIRFVVPFAGTVESLARSIGDHITSTTGQPVLIEQRPGAGGNVAAQYVAKQAPDGYQVLFTTNTTHAANPAIYPSLPYDPVKDFAPVTAVAKGALLYIGSTSMPETLREVLALAKQKPNALSFGWAGSSGRAAFEILNLTANIQLRNVPYKSSPQALADILGGHIDLLAYPDISASLQLAQNGKLRVFGVSTSERLEIAPDVPTVREQGFPGFEMVYWVATYAPTGTPAAVVMRLNSLINTAMRTERLRVLVRSAGLITYATTPEELAKFQADETAKWRRIVTAAGMQEKL